MVENIQRIPRIKNNLVYRTFEEYDVVFWFKRKTKCLRPTSCSLASLDTSPDSDTSPLAGVTPRAFCLGKKTFSWTNIRIPNIMIGSPAGFSDHHCLCRVSKKMPINNEKEDLDNPFINHGGDNHII